MIRLVLIRNASILAQEPVALMLFVRYTIIVLCAVVELVLPEIHFIYVDQYHVSILKLIICVNGNFIEIYPL